MSGPQLNFFYDSITWAILDIAGNRIINEILNSKCDLFQDDLP